MIPNPIRRSVALFAAGLLAMSMACSRQSRNEKSEALSLEANIKKAEADSIWAVMEASDNRKIENVRYFLGLLRYTDGLADTAQVHRVRIANDSLLALRYNQQNLRQLVDGYDQRQDRILQGVAEIYNQSEELKRMLNAEQALTEIKAADDSVLVFRFMYDRAAEGYNNALKASKGSSGQQPIPLFRINS